MRRADAAVLALVLAACTGEGAIAPLTLALVDDVPACAAVQIGGVTSVEVVAVGTGDGGADCRLDRACIEVSPSATLAGLEDRLAASPQPVLDVGTEALASVRVRGFDQQGCSGELRLCGIADVAAASDGHLSVAVVCDGRLAQRCPAGDLPACP